MSATGRVIRALQDRGCSVRGSTAQCPAHEDRAPSLSIGPRSDGKGVVLHCHAGCAPEDIAGALGLNMGDLFDEPIERRERPRVVAEYTYCDEHGEVLYLVRRLEPGYDGQRKTFRQFRPDGSPGVSGIRRVLYQLPEVIAAAQGGGTILIPEGEKDVENLRALGVAATCNVGGAGKWHDAYTSHLRGAGQVIVIADRDDPGRKHAQQVADSVRRAGIPVRIVEAAKGKDVSDHLAAGLGFDDLLPVDEAQEEPPADAEPLEPLTEVRAPLPRTWQAQDLEDVLNGTYTPPRPTVGRRDDGVGMFYPGRVNTVICETEGGKTWLALTAALQEINDGHHVVYIDFEDDRAGVVGRLLVLGGLPDTIRRYFHYIRPENRPTPADVADLGQYLALRPTLAVIDGITEAMSLYGQEISDNTGAAAFGRELLRPIKNSGAAVVTLDHVVKSAEGRGQGRYAIGAVHKLNGLDGVQYTMENIQPFGIGLVGRTRVRIAKDRPAQIRRHALPGQANQLRWFMDMVITSHDENFAEVNLYPPIQHEPDTEAEQAEKEREEREEAQILAAEEKVLDVLRNASEPISQKTIIDLAPGRASVTRRAVTRLVHSGRVIGTPGPRNALLCSLPSADEGGDS